MFRNFRGMSNTQRVLFYYRASPDHRRVVFGGRASFREITAAQAAPCILATPGFCQPLVAGTAGATMLPDCSRDKGV